MLEMMYITSHLCSSSNRYMPYAKLIKINYILHMLLITRIRISLKI